MAVKVDDRYCCCEDGVHPNVTCAQCVKVIEVSRKDGVTFVTATKMGTLDLATFEQAFRKVDCYGCQALP